MTPDAIIKELQRNRKVFLQLLDGISGDQVHWSQGPEKWNLLEIVCHLRDEEAEDFRTRVFSVLEDPLRPLPPFDPIAWVSERKYRDQDYQKVLVQFIEERDISIRKLQSLEGPKWENTYDHPKLGPMSAYLFLANWYAHDLLHIRQILRLKYDFLKYTSKTDLKYAGNW